MVNIEDLFQDFKTQKQKLDGIMEEVANLDSERLNLAVQIAQEGPSFDKIWATLLTSNESDMQILKKVYTYLEKDKKKIKGIKLAEYKGEHYSKDEIREEEDKYELWLTPNSFIKTHVTGELIKGPWGRVELTRTVLSYDYDPLTIINDKFEWNIDNIISCLENKLVERNNDLSVRIKKQTERLEKLKKLNIL